MFFIKLRIPDFNDVCSMEVMNNSKSNYYYFVCFITLRILGAYATT